MIKVNLVPAEILAKAAQKQQAVQAAIVGVAAAALILMISVAHVVREKRLDTELAQNEAELKKLAAIVAQVEELDQKANAVRARLKVIHDLDKGRPLYPFFMSDFAKSLPPGVAVKTLGTATQGSGSLRLNISAESRTSEDIAAWIKNMMDTQKFTAIEMGAVSTSGEGPTRAYNFTLTCGYNAKL